MSLQVHTFCLGDSLADIWYHKALALRSQEFRDGLSSDEDQFDQCYTHVVVADGDRVVAYQRYYRTQARLVDATYTGHQYNMRGVRRRRYGDIIDSGRLCADSTYEGSLNPVAMAFTPIIDRFETDSGVIALIGCVSFHGDDPRQHHDAFLTLNNKKLRCPYWWRPAPKAASSFKTYPFWRLRKRRGMGRLPGAMMLYRGFGAVVGRFAVIDTDLQTLHVPVFVFRSELTLSRLVSAKRMLGLL